MLGSGALGLAVALVRRGRQFLWIAWGLWLGWLFSLAPAPGGLGGSGGPPATEAGASASVARDEIRR